jgi:hypothetical protein
MSLQKLAFFGMTGQNEMRSKETTKTMATVFVLLTDRSVKEALSLSPHKEGTTVKGHEIVGSVELKQ